MPMIPIAALIPVAMALTPLGPAQEARLAAWLNWGVAYRDCYEPAPFGMRIDEAFTAHCIEAALRLRRGATVEQQAATDALIAATPSLVALLNAAGPGSERGAKTGDGKAFRLDPPAHPAFR
jgi:hypothetical protein